MSRLRFLLLTSLLACAVLLLTPFAAAQEPACPSGFHWDRLSGVGCVQSNCFDVGNAYWSYTGQCVCAEGYKPCSEPVDSSGIECGPFCPTSQLVACIAPDAACPGTAPGGFGEDGQPGGGGAFGRPDETTGDTDRSTDGDGDRAFEAPDLDTLVRDLEQFLAGQSVSPPTPGQAAVSGAVLAAALGAWVLLQVLSGVPAADALRAVRQWRGAQPTTASEETAPEEQTTTATRPLPAADRIGELATAAQVTSTVEPAQAGIIPSPASHASQPLPWGGKTQHFEMRVVDSIEVGGFGAVMKMEVEIRSVYKDPHGAWRKSGSVRYRFIGFGVTLGGKYNSLGFSGSWEPFRTINPVSLDQFEGFGTYKNKGFYALGPGVSGPTEIWFQNTTTRVKPKGKYARGIGASYWTAYGGAWTRM